MSELDAAIRELKRPFTPAAIRMKPQSITKNEPKKGLVTFYVDARLVSERLTTVYKQTVLVDNRPGVSGTVGTRLAVKARNDGYTLFLGQTGEIAVNRVLMKPNFIFAVSQH